MPDPPPANPVRVTSEDRPPTAAQRIVGSLAFLCALVTAGGGTYSAIQSRDALPTIALVGVIALAAATIGAVGLWTALLFRRPDEARRTRITIDHDQRTVRFENARFVRSGFQPLAPRVPDLALPFDDILSAKVYHRWRPPAFLFIVTTRGSVFVTTTVTNFSALVRALQTAIENRRPRPTDRGRLT